MLPFLKDNKKSVAGLIIKNRTPDKTSDSAELEPTSSPGKDLIDAIQAGDASKVESAIKAIMSAKSNVEPHSYEAQNQAAVKKD